MRIDSHTHYFPAPLIEALEARDELPRVRTHDGSRLLEYGPGGVFPLTVGMTDLARKVEDMDAADIDLSILSFNLPGVDWFNAAEGEALARELNAVMVDAVRSHPGRFAGLAALPMQAPEAAANELERAVAAGLKGAMIYSNVAGVSLDETRFRSVFDAASNLDVPMMVHPTYPLSAPSMDVHALVPVFGFLVDTATAVLRLIFDGFYERYPAFKLILPHTGSVLTYLVGRLDVASAVPGTGGRGALKSPPSESVRRLYTDTVCAWSPALEMAVKLLGADRVMYGTDHPFWDAELADQTITGVSLTSNQRRAIEVTTAEHVFGLDPGP